jgi:hypothetical protein
MLVSAGERETRHPLQKQNKSNIIASHLHRALVSVSDSHQVVINPIKRFPLPPSKMERGAEKNCFSPLQTGVNCST